MFVHCVSEAPLQVTGVQCSTLTVSRTTYTSRRKDNGTYVVERDACLSTAAKNVAKMLGTRLESRWRGNLQLFCCARTIMARALLNFGFFTYRSPHHSSKIWPKKFTSGRSTRVVGAAIHKSPKQVTHLFAGLAHNGTCIVELWLFGSHR